MRELKAKVRNFVLERVEGGVYLLTRPFSEAPDLAAYSRRGFYLLGILIAVVTLILWWQGVLSAPLSSSNAVIRAIYKALSEKTVIFKYVPDNYVPLALVPAFIYVVLGIWRRTREVLGEATANSSFWLLNKGISAGEWCIEHRWYSLLLIGALSAGIAVLVTLQVQKMTSTKVLQNDFESWMDAADHFITHNPLTKGERAAYERVRAAWREEFKGLFPHDEGSTHPAMCLQEMLDELYLDERDLAWIDFLQLKMTRLREKAQKCAAPADPKKDPTDVRSRALINLLMARITVRITDDVDVQRYSTYAELNQALALFRTVAELDYGNADHGKRYRADGHNGQGTVYSNALSAYMNSSSPPTSEQMTNLRSLCGSPAQCALKSLQEYQAAGRGWPDCSYQGKRVRNNTADLLIRIGQNYDRLASSLKSKPLAEWTRTRLRLAQQIESDIQRLMRCNSTESFLSPFAITAAQGLAVCAYLRRQDGQNADAYLVAAARYLRLANSFESQNASKWDYSSFCFAAPKGVVEPLLREAITTGPDGLPNADQVVATIESQCR